MNGHRMPKDRYPRVAVISIDSREGECNVVKCNLSMSKLLGIDCVTCDGVDVVLWASSPIVRHTVFHINRVQQCA